MPNALLITAHPDDETLWAGGLLLTTARKGVLWTVLCCTIPRRDPERALVKFHKAAEALGVHYVTLGYAKDNGPHDEIAEDELSAALGMAVDYEWDAVVTHGPAGEYGHTHHKQLSREVPKRWPNAGFISYGAKLPRTKPHTVVLTEEEYEAKLAALRCYDHVLPYEGTPMPKWQALLRRYSSAFNLMEEPYESLPHCLVV